MLRTQATLLCGLMASLALAGCFGGDSGEATTHAATESELLPWSGTPVPEAVFDFSGSYSRVARPGDLGILPLAKTYLASEVDGVDIEVGVWLPDGPGPFPVIADAGPYYGNNGPPMEAQSGHLGRLIANFVPHGYAVAGLAVRGTGGSGGCMDLMGPNEVADLSQAVTWLGTQSWSNGNVGMIGKSYDGSTPWMVAAAGNPHLKTIVPISGVPDIHELMFRNGTAEIRGPFLLNALYYSFAVREQGPVPTDTESGRRTAVHTAEGLACPDHVVGMEAAIYSGVLGDHDPTGYWTERRLKERVEENYVGSVLMVQGLQDWNVDPALSIPWADELNRSGLFVHQYLGQWGHSYPDDGYPPADDPNMRWDWAEHLLRWFDHWLKGDAHRPLGPPVQVLSADGRWRMDTSFPPRDAQRRVLHLSSGGTLAAEPQGSGRVVLAPQAHSLTAAGLPVAPMARADFTTQPLEADTHISGLPRVHVTVVPQGPVGHLAAWLYDLSPDGSQEPIGWTMINLRFADGGYEPQQVEPGQKLVARMEVQPLDAVVPEGHQLLLRVWQYRDEVPGNEVQGRLPPPTAPVELLYGAGERSVLELPVVNRPDDWFFTPPRPAA